MLIARFPAAAEWLRQATPVDWFLLALRIFVVVVVGTGFIAGLAHPRYGREEWFSFLAFGLTIGAIYALIALGYTMVYGILRMVNFAHGDVFMFGSYAACFTLLACNRSGLLVPYPWPCLLLALVMAVAVSSAPRRARRAHRLPPVPARPAPGAADQHARPVLRAGILGARHVRRAGQVVSRPSPRSTARSPSARSPCRGRSSSSCWPPC